MRSKPSTASVTAIRNRLPAELYFGGAADESSRLVLGYSLARQRQVEPLGRSVAYFPHYQLAAATRFVHEMTISDRPLALIGHSWGADTLLRVASCLNVPALLIGADPVAKPALPTVVWKSRPAAARYVLHVDAIAETPDRSDYVKAAGYWTGGGIPRIFREADQRISTRFNHWNFAGMMTARGPDGKSAEDWLDAFSDL